jgi:hypothetical protein
MQAGYTYLQVQNPFLLCILNGSPIAYLLPKKYANNFQLFADF